MTAETEPPAFDLHFTHCLSQSNLPQLLDTLEAAEYAVYVLQGKFIHNLKEFERQANEDGVYEQMKFYLEGRDPDLPPVELNPTPNVNAFIDIFTSQCAEKGQEKVALVWLDADVMSSHDLEGLLLVWYIFMISTARLFACLKEQGKPHANASLRLFLLAEGPSFPVLFPQAEPASP